MIVYGVEESQVRAHYIKFILPVVTHEDFKISERCTYNLLTFPVPDGQPQRCVPASDLRDGLQR